jgi:hypothetical protein
MGEQSILVVVILILIIAVVIIVYPLLYKIFAGKSPNLACKEFASKFTLYGPFFLIQFQPFVPLCDLFIM